MIGSLNGDVAVIVFASPDDGAIEGFEFFQEAVLVGRDGDP